MGVLLLGLWGVGCRGPLVVAYPAPRDPLTSLDRLEPGQTEVSGAVVNALVPTGSDVEILPADSAAGLIFDAPYKLSVAHAFGPVEIRALGTSNLQGRMFGGGVGVALPKLGAWTPILEGGYAFQRIRGGYTVPAERDEAGEQIAEERQERYSYKVHAPYGRVRMVRELGPRFRVPVSLKVNRSLTQARYGLDGPMPRETYTTLATGVVFDPGPGCLSLGFGVMLRLEELGYPGIEAAASCAFGGRR